MNFPSILIILLILLCVWYAIHTLRKKGGNPCSGCDGGCSSCKEKFNG